MADLNVIYRIAADISGLQSGVDRAAKATEGLEGQAKQLNKAFEDFAKNFKIDQAITNPLDSAKKAAEDFAATLGPMATAALGAATALAAIGTALFEMAESAAKVGAELDDLSDKTGVSVPALSKLSQAAAVAGTDLNTLTTALFKLQRSLGEDPEKVGKALAKIGLSLEQLKEAGPDQYLELIAQGFAQTSDPAKRAAASVELFKDKTGDMVPVLLDLAEGFKRTADIEPWTTEQAKQAEQFEQQIKSIKIHIEAFSTAIGRDLIGPISTFVDLMGGAAKVTEGFAENVFGGPYVATLHAVAEEWRYLAAAVSLYKGAAAGLPAPQGKAPTLPTLPGLNVPVMDESRAIAELTAEYNKLVAAQKKAAEDAKSAAAIRAEVLKVNNQAMVGEIDALKNVGRAAHDADATLIRLADSQKKVGEEILKVNNQAIVGEIDSLKHLGRAATDGEGAMIRLADANKHVADTIRDIERGVPLSPSSLPGYVVNPKNEVQITKLKGSVDELARAFAHLATITKGQFSDIARAVGETLETFDIGIESAKKLDESLGLFKKGDLKGGIEGATKAFAAMTGAMIQATSHASALQNVIQGAATGAGFGGPIGAVAGAIIGIERSQANHATLLRQIRDANDQLIALHGSAENLARAAQNAGFEVDKLFRASTVEAYTQAVNELNAALQFQDSAMQTLDDTVKKYGFSLEELGPKLQAQDLDKKAQSLYQDFKVLTSAGIDVGTVIGKMKGGLQDFVDEARKTGIAIPLSMKPILQQMIDMGELVDENGNAFNSLEDTGLSFTESLSQGMDRLIDTIDKLTEAILRGLNAAAGIDVRPPTGPGRPAETGAASGGVVTRWGVEPISWRAVGQDIIPAMLAPGEIVLNPSEQAQIAAGLAGADGWRSVGSDLEGLREDLRGRLGETTVTINVSALDVADFQTAVEKKIFPAMIAQLQRGRGVTQLEDVLGLR